MPAAKKTHYTNEFKFKVAIASIRGQQTLAELVAEYNVASCLISKWKKQLLDYGSSAFATTAKPQSLNDKEKQLYEQLGRQSMEINYLKKFVDRYQ